MTTMGAHIFPFGPQAIQQGQGKIRVCYFCAAIEGATRSGCMTWAHNLLSRRKVYSILYSSTLILPSNRRGERLLRLLLLLDCCGREQEALYYYSEIQVVYIVII